MQRAWVFIAERPGRPHGATRLADAVTLGVDEPQVGEIAARAGRSG